jgi:HPt (histidine-containing phosphotransfer) domain-containing protein
MVHPYGFREKWIVWIDPDLRALIPEFLENRWADLKAMQEAVSGEEFETVRIRGHRMKGSGGGYGFDRLSEIGRELEQAAEQKNRVEIEKLLQRLEDYLGRIEVGYEETE